MLNTSRYPAISCSERSRGLILSATNARSRLGTAVTPSMRLELSELGSALTTARVGFFLDEHREALFVEEYHLKALREQAPRQPRYLDRKREAGRLVKPWNLVVPERVLNRTWGEVA